MNMQIGDEGTRQMIIKKRTQMKALLVEHEVKAGLMPHLMLLNELVRMLETEVQVYRDGEGI